MIQALSNLNWIVKVGSTSTPSSSQTLAFHAFKNDVLEDNDDDDDDDVNDDDVGDVNDDDDDDIDNDDDDNGDDDDKW